ncbi:hypothetical protein AO069_26725 [Pseudomonas syringae pv. syringae PD2774]|uniref:alcohol dehydrogenase catalytic domain-containing protein n=1 Tax=Pseudomonas syringae TaxID=317 RepID=UPI000736737A|nr:alcohol dehydrogenase catalytic domain-containing protein [Pseudomonas syringae]KTB82389.1 hypothetical protein AO069_26725 [Pseudomonas syringae pv. syringae PD2774]
MQVKAAVLRRMNVAPPYAQSKLIAIETIELAPPGPGEVLVRIRAACLCHSILSVINGDRPRPMPMALGHEAAGVVEALSEGINDLEPGDHVVMVFMPSYGPCLPCAKGRPALCEPGAIANAAGTLINGAVVNTAQLRAGSTAVIIGLGGVGLASVLGARAAGASKIIAVEG